MGMPYTIIETLTPEFNPGDVIIEIGGNRGEGSTAFLGNFAKENQLEFHSVDIDSTVYKADFPGATTHAMNGEDFLLDFVKKIKFAYLDNYDWVFANDVNAQLLRERYKRFGMQHSNLQSMATHLIQAYLINQRADHPCYILFDDTWKTPDGDYMGKGGLAVSYLLFKGYEILVAPRGADEMRTSSVLMGKE